MTGGSNRAQKEERPLLVRYKPRIMTISQIPAMEEKKGSASSVLLDPMFLPIQASGANVQ